MLFRSPVYKAWEPFKKVIKSKSKWFDIFKRFGLNWLPQNVVQSRERNQGAITDSFVEKAKLIERIVDKKFTGEVDKELMESMMYKGLMASLGDPYSAYYTSEEHEELNTETTGSYKGIGVVMQMHMETGTVKVVRCYETAPGAKVGLQPEDILVAVNGKSIVGKELSEVVDEIKASEDEIAHLTIARDGEADYRSIR